MAPFLPPDLEREIFDVVASEGMKSIPPLLRVAQRVKLWMEPLLYRVIFLQEDNNPFNLHAQQDLFKGTRDVMIPPQALAAAIERLPASFFRTHVRHVFLDCRAFTLSTLSRDHQAAARLNGRSVEDRDALLARCTGAVSMYIISIQDAPSLLACLSRVPLRRLEANLGALFHPVADPIPFKFSQFGEGGGTIDFSRPMFQHLTHLALAEKVPKERSRRAAEWKAGLASLPCLTHLSFEYRGREPHPLFLQLLYACACLRVLVILVPDDPEGQTVGTALKELGKHPRLVVMKNHNNRGGANDWHRGVRGLGDFWDRAEKRLEARRLEGRQATTDA
ncbi:hypothetical protein DFH06DRAFT_1471757 [Mycena polygramma]|nr:hypothetical protein DFH06DRAFT_1471757 [Mycena polygramma]